MFRGVASSFKSYKSVLIELYKRLDGVQKYQIFSIDSGKPGVVACKKGPDSDAVEQDLRRKIDEKREQLYKTIRPYVPDEFQNDTLYAKPSEEEGAPSKTQKQARLAHRAAMAAAAKKNQEGRGMAEGSSDTEPYEKKKPAPKKRAAPSKKAAAKPKKHKSPAAPDAEEE
ncbi:hypothetical protein PR003_g23281 [Phytophthora rubi]|uniref:Uncharacterized protein n=1 Tax=Phytophthora rubi TaxID=129364 RepID=A0A6A3IY86_9STRA|nr:hypothetical protein PR001_g22166 [Phytophthora rubi]KAE9298288.1 hypothetical protein PR003_g23281 [Phytophthora rubi]